MLWNIISLIEESNANSETKISYNFCVVMYGSYGSFKASKFLKAHLKNVHGKIGWDYLVIVTQNQAQNWNFATFITSLQEGVTEFTVQWQFFFLACTRACSLYNKFWACWHNISLRAQLNSLGHTGIPRFQRFRFLQFSI